MQTLQIDISNPINQKHARHFVERHIGENQTMFVSELFERGMFSYDDVINLVVIDRDAFADVFYDTLRDEYCLNDDGSHIEREIYDQVYADYNLMKMDEEDIRDMCEEYNLDYEYWRTTQSIYEWWQVSDWLAGHLKRKGEPILENDYGTWWGRTGCGQAICMDEVMQGLALQH